MPDLNHSIDEHRENLRGWCSSPRHIAARKIQVEKHPLCSRCGRPATCVLHEYRIRESEIEKYLKGRESK